MSEVSDVFGWSAAGPPGLLLVVRLSWPGWASRLPGRCHFLPVLAGTLRHRPGQARRTNGAIRYRTGLGLLEIRVISGCSPSCPDPPRKPNPPRCWDADALPGPAGRRPAHPRGRAAHTALRHPDSLDEAEGIDPPRSVSPALGARDTQALVEEACGKRTRINPRLPS